MFKPVNPRQSFPELEKEIINHWKANDTFKKSIETRENSQEFNFYDGPPFATGTPHYGHILAGTIKDVIPRYQTMLGKKVERRFGWDCHGLPIENIVEKKLQISGKDDIENKIGVHDFNETCRANVFGYAQDWKKVVERMGRWVDMENDYKTMDTSFMESVWWVFKNIYDKGLIYEGNRIVPYCPRCTTPLSNFEVNQGYKDKQSKTVTVKFKVKSPHPNPLQNGDEGEKGKYILAWTTTPWTLYANLGLAVGNDIMYSEVLDKTTGETYILASEKVKDYYKKEEDFVIVREYKGSCLVGIKYEPLFPDFDIELREMGKDLGTGIKLGKNAFSVVAGHHVTTETGVGIVHIAPAYGEDDFIIGEKEDLGFVSHIDNSGKSYNLLDKNGINVFELNDMVISELKEQKLSINIGTIVHSYPHCWRCDTPLIYRGISAWYVAVEKIREKMVANNQKITWVPDVIKHGRFGKWLEGAKDWNISRNRYWGSAIPVWQSEDKKSEVCVGSIEELYELNKDYGQITKVILVRHGRTDYNEQKREDILGRAKLNEKGLSQAQEIKEVLKNKNIDVIYSSPLERCINTITPLAEELNLNILMDSGLKEVNIGDFNGTSDMNRKYFRENKNEVIPGGESYAEMEKRLKETYKKILKENVGKTILICSHGDPSYVILSEIMGFEISAELDKNIYLANKTDDINKIFSIKYVYSNSGKEVDLHKHFVDEIFVKCPKTGEKLKRIPEVLDCWFESGAMPYASKHYPFAFQNPPIPNPFHPGEKGEIKDSLNSFSHGGKDAGKADRGTFRFPADFIAEGLDQTRGWFYTLVILSTALFDNPAFLNCIVNGIILAEDGKKMSKSLKNYTDPSILMDKFGADAMRFYLMNSPVVEAQDLRFSDAGVEEVVKKVILPLWNTYSFFTTYANIDKFEPKSGNIYFVRHGQTDNNKNGIVNGGNDNLDLNETGINQAHILGKKLQTQDLQFDIIISSPLLRAKNTAEIIKSYLNYEVEIIENQSLKEQNYGEFKGMSHEEISKKYNCKTKSDLQKTYRNNSEENVEQFQQRITKAYKEIQEKYSGKNVLIVAHGGVFRVINKYVNDLDTDFSFFKSHGIKNAKIYKLPNISRQNPLDKWIISELNILVGEVANGLDNYKLNESTKSIVKFMDNLTNWYVRRSRKRFWGSEMTSDKLQAYETLYEVLVETCKIIAPYMPFVSEHIFINLTKKESVHLELFPEVNNAFILENLSKNVSEVQDLITLGLSARANAKIRVRQPLSYVKITTELDEYFKDILKEELNVKEIKVFSSEEIPSQICKPNARLIGPKFAGDVKFIISEAKAGNFKLLENGSVLIPNPPIPTPFPPSEKGNNEEGFILLPGEFEIEFVSNELSKNTNEIFESGSGKVIALDTNITEELKLEGYARDIVRHIQEARKEANFNVDDRIEASFESESGLLKEILKNFSSYIETETLSLIVEKIENPKIKKQVDFEELSFEVSLKN